MVIRMRGPIANHPASVILPLLLPDSPVVIWWPGKAPTDQTGDELAQLTMRRLTDAASAKRPLAAIKARARDYSPGDTDLSWTRLTPWRALLAAALDQYPAEVNSALVESEKANPSADLLAAWLERQLKLPVKRKVSGGPGLTAVRLGTASGDIAITRPDGLLAAYAVPGQPERRVALKRRDMNELISEELRRMDADHVYERDSAGVARKGLGMAGGTPEILVHSGSDEVAEALAARLLARLAEIQRDFRVAAAGPDRRPDRDPGVSAAGRGGRELRGRLVTGRAVVGRRAFGPG